jgi:DNA-directed RNA polymerase subunit alpha
MPHIQTLHLTETHGKFVVEPLERGYGQTIGNSMRRVLLSSIQGPGIAAVKIGGVMHEFSAIPGLKEDATQFILNLRDLAICGEAPLDGEEQVVLKIDVKGPGQVTGADVVCPAGYTIANPECPLAYISGKESFTAELYVKWGSGYVLPDRHEEYKGIIGVLPIGTQFTPVRKVNYLIEATRVGTRTDYERLILEVQTNGAIAPSEAASRAAHILHRSFTLFFSLGSELDAEMPVLAEPAGDQIELVNVPEIKLEELDFSQRTFNCLRRAGILTLRQLAVVTEADLTGIRGFGRKSLMEVKDKLAEFDVDLKTSRAFLGDDDEDEE